MAYDLTASISGVPLACTMNPYGQDGLSFDRRSRKRGGNGFLTADGFATGIQSYTK
ncbi:hypothetical protein D3C85_706540 [compost metagenome]